MGLLIKQGTHKDEKKLESTYETAQITNLKEIKDNEDNIVEGVMSVELTVITEGAYKGKKVFDRVPYDPEDSMAWKYKALRRHAGVPYDKSEPQEIDIEDLLLNKAVGVKLSIYKHTDGREFQNVNYIAVETNATSGAKDSADQESVGEKPEIDTNLDDLEDLDAEDTAEPKKETKEEVKQVDSAIDDAISDDDFPF